MRSRDPSLSKVSSPSRVSFPNTLHLYRDDTDEPWTSRLQYPQPLWCVVLLEQEQQPCTAISGGKVIECVFPLAVALYPSYRFLFLECYQSRGVAAWIVHGCEGSGSVQTLSQCFFDPNSGGWLWSTQLLWRWLWGGWWVQWSGHCFSRAFGRCCHPRLPWTALSNWPVSLPHWDISLDISHPRTGSSCLADLN